ncbi:hypothetical protein RN03_0431 [Mycobacterium tuberculosis]|nr:hypothetical protein RN03_0431 [Mycobacterium tuberculosis]
MGLGGDDGRLGNPAGLVVAVAFGGDAMGAVLGAGAGPARHHRGALPAAVGAGRLGCGRVTGGVHSAGNSSALPGVVT